jgi:hypothetical protein
VELPGAAAALGGAAGALTVAASWTVAAGACAEAGVRTVANDKATAIRITKCAGETRIDNWQIMGTVFIVDGREAG